MAEEQAPTKKAKTDVDAAAEPEKKDDVEMKDAEANAPAEAEAEAAPEPEKPEKVEEKELEEDAPEAKGARLKEKVSFNAPDTTLNVMKSDDGGAILKTMSADGFQLLLGGARANVGAKSGRYMFEVKILGNESYTQDYHATQQQHYLRIGVSTASSTPIPGSDANSIAFDNQRCLWHNNKPQYKIGYQNGRWDDNGRGMVFAVVVNLDEASPNANTISLFKDGERASPPQAIPDALKGKPLFPTIAFKNMSLHVNFGAEQLKPLPFKCRMFQEATAKDVEVRADSMAKDGKCEVVIPVGLPDQGTHHYLDLFHEKNPGYTELSARALLNWAERSNLPNVGGKAWRKTNDELGETQVGSFDDGSVSRLIKKVAPLQKRNYVIFEVKNNLLEEQRKVLLNNFPSHSFKKVAQVSLGDPDKEFVAKTHEELLRAKQRTSDIEFRKDQAEKKRQKQIEKRKKDAEKAAKKREKEVAKKKKEAEKAKKAAEKAKKAEEKAKKAEEKKEGDEEEKEAEEEEKEEEEEEPEPVSEDEPEEPVEEDKEEDPPKVELDAEEKAQKFLKIRRPDLSFQQVAESFEKYSVPDKAEGFDEVRFSWADDKKSKAYLRSYIIDQKVSSRVQNIGATPWFRERVSAWEKEVATWHAKVKAYRAAVQARLQKKQEKERKAAAAAKKKAAEEAKAAKKAEEDEKAKAEGKEVEEEKKDEKKEEAAAMEVDAEEKEEEEEEVVDVDLAGLNPFEVEDVCDVGGGKPLCIDFQQADWTLMGLRFQLSLLVAAFRKDVEDPERLGIILEHLSYYYKRYFSQDLYPNKYGCETNEGVLDLVKDIIYLTDKQVLASQLDGEMESFQILVKLTEAARRERTLRIDLGDASARLKIDTQQSGGGGRDWHGGKGKDQHQQKGYDKGKGDGKGYGKSYGKDDRSKGAGKGYDKSHDKGNKSGGYHIRQEWKR